MYCTQNTFYKIIKAVVVILGKKKNVGVISTNLGNVSIIILFFSLKLIKIKCDLLNFKFNYNITIHSSKNNVIKPIRC